MLDTRVRKNCDWLLLAFCYLLAALGILVIFSATQGDATAFYKKQVFSIALGSIALVVVALTDYHIYPRFARHLYGINLLLLIAVFQFAPNIKGSARWIKIAGFPFQPSEFAKLLVILTLAAFIAQHQDRIKDFRTLLLTFGFIAVPAALIFKQPDLGTALVILAIWFGMVFIAGARIRHLLVFLLAGLLLFAGMWHTGKIKNYQKERLITFLNPEANANDTGYHVIQARIAIGSGGMWGKGLLNSTQVRAGYIPEKQTDFIFTSLSEELGFAGAVTVTVLYALLLLRGALIIAAADEDIYGKLVATGIVSMFAFHIILNIGMNIGIMPVAGVPLIFLSYGGSNAIVSLLCIGLLQSIAMHRHPLMF